MSRNNRFIKYFCAIGSFGPIVIFSYYTYIESWLLGYSVFAVVGKYAGCADQPSMTEFLKGYQGVVSNEHFSGMGPAYLFFVITFSVNVLVVGMGISKGIERFCTWAMPLLFIMAAILLYGF
jgi:SNF family Na+-dependent transporter